MMLPLAVAMLLRHSSSVEVTRLGIVIVYRAITLHDYGQVPLMLCPMPPVPTF